MALDLISAESAQANLGTFQPVCSAVVLKPPLAIQSVLWIYDGGWRTDLGDKSDFLSPKNPIISFKKSNHIILENNEKTGVPFSTISIVKSCFTPILYDILMLKNYYKPRLMGQLYLTSPSIWFPFDQIFVSSIFFVQTLCN